MPKNNELEKINFPQKKLFNVPEKTEFKNNLESIKIKLIQAPSFEELLVTLPKWVKATWMNNVDSTDELTLTQKYAIIYDVFHNKTLPSAKETVNFVFQIDGISIQEVTHILRHRNASFSADCSADKWWTEKDCLVPYSVENSKGAGKKIDDIELDDINYYDIERDNYEARYKKLTKMCKELYCDMIDTKEISILDARYILPRNLSTFYFMRINLNDLINFIHQRIDRQIQPETDNLLAYKMYIEIIKNYPVANGMIDINEPARHFINTARSGKSSNIYPPESNSDLFDWNEEDFIYRKTRDEVCGTSGGKGIFYTDVFPRIKEELAYLEQKNELKILKNTGYKLDEIVRMEY